MLAPVVRTESAIRGAAPGPEPWTMNEAGVGAILRRHLGERRTRRRHAARATPWQPPQTGGRADATQVRRGADHLPIRNHRGARARQRAIPAQPPAVGRIKHLPSPDQPMHSGCGTRSRTGILRSWCSATSQFFSGDLSKSVHWTATAPWGRSGPIWACAVNVLARFRHEGTSSKFRAPARPAPPPSIAVISSAHWPVATAPGICANPASSSTETAPMSV